jgi:nicotinamidase-related amidase
MAPTTNSTKSSSLSADPRTSAIIVVDLANDFVYAGGTIADAGGAEYQSRAATVIPPLQRLLTAAREAGVTVIFSTDAHTPTDSELRKWPPHSMAGTHQAQIVDGLTPQEGDVVLGKRTYSQFQTDDAIDRILADRGIRTVYIAGLHTDCCARHTSGDVFQRGYDLVWVTDALQAFTQAQHEAGLEYYKAWYATDAERQLKTADEIVAEWKLAAEKAAPAQLVGAAR